MNRKYWILGVSIGAVVSVVVALIMTFLDWRLNPDGIFHNEHGTDWMVVAETAASWFVPMALVVGASALIVLFLLAIFR